MKVFAVGFPSIQAHWVLDSGDGVEAIAKQYGATCLPLPVQPDDLPPDFTLPRDAGRLAKALREARPQ